MNTCDTCKWWHPGREGSGGCGNPKLSQPAIHHSDQLGSLGPEIDGLLVKADDDRGYLSTGPKFGCIHHEPK